MTLYYTRYNKILHIPFYSNSYDKILHPLTQNAAQPFLLEIRMTLYYTHYNKILHILFYSNSYDKILHPLTQNTAHPFLLEFVWQYTTTKYVSNFNVITLFLILPSITSAITTSYSLPCQRVPNSVLSPTIVHFITTSSHFNLHNLLPNNLVFHSLRSKL